MEKILRETESTGAVADPAAVLEHLFQVEYPGMVRLAFTLVGSTQKQKT